MWIAHHTDDYRAQNKNYGAKTFLSSQSRSVLVPKTEQTHSVQIFSGRQFKPMKDGGLDVICYTRYLVRGFLKV